MSSDCKSDWVTTERRTLPDFDPKLLNNCFRESS